MCKNRQNIPQKESFSAKKGKRLRIAYKTNKREDKRNNLNSSLGQCPSRTMMLQTEAFAQTDTWEAQRLAPFLPTLRANVWPAAAAGCQ